MTEDRFEGWLRSLSGVATRRQAAAGLATLIAGGAIAMAPGGNAGASTAARKKGKGHACRNKPDGAKCDKKGQCLDGACKHAPTCDSAGATCGEGHFDCCSGLCLKIIGESTGTCAEGDAGAKCRVDGDCASGQCVGFRCRG